MSEGRARRGWMIASVFAAVMAADLALVAAIGTDIPFHDQWNVEGQWLYPTWLDGRLTIGDLARPLNEHRIVWTHLLNLGLFSANGQWDPLVQLAAIGLLRGACAAVVSEILARGGGAGAPWLGAAAAVAFLPHLAWHAVLWGIESQVHFALAFSLVSLAALSGRELSARRMVVGVLAGVAGLLAMAPAALAPVALLALAGLRALESRCWRSGWPLSGVAGGLFAVAWFLRIEAPEHGELHASASQFIAATANLLAWPHAGGGPVALVMNAPLALAIIGRLLRRRPAAVGEDAVVAVGMWSAGIALATAWVRGGSAELGAGVPSRYVDFVVLLPLVNGWCALTLVKETVAKWKPARWVGFAWAGFVALGWVGLSAEVWRGLVGPRWRDREAPVRLMRAYQTSGDAEVFRGQPRLLVPHPNLASVRAVLDDPRLRGRLPPSLQPEREPGPLSRGVRAVLDR